MSHNVLQVRLGASASTAKDISVHNVDPASFRAGTAVSMASSGLPSKLASAGMRMGVSMGPSLSDSKKLAVLRCGEKVPMLASLKRASGVITVSSYANLVNTTPDTVTVGATVFTAQSGAATPGQTTFQAATDNATTAISLAAQINAHATAGALVYAVVTSSGVVTVYSIVDGAGATGTGNDIALVYTDNHSDVGITLSGLSSGKLSGGSDTVASIDYIVKGAKAYINAVTGKLDAALAAFSVVSDAMYVDGPLTGIDEDGALVAAGRVDMPGGL